MLYYLVVIKDEEVDITQETFQDLQSAISWIGRQYGIMNNDSRMWQLWIRNRGENLIDTKIAEGIF